MLQLDPEEDHVMLRSNGRIKKLKENLKEGYGEIQWKDQEGEGTIPPQVTCYKMHVSKTAQDVSETVIIK